MVRGVVGPTNTTHQPPTFQYEAMRVSAKPLQGGCVGHQVKKTKQKKPRSYKYVPACAKKINNTHQQFLRRRVLFRPSFAKLINYKPTQPYTTNPTPATQPNCYTVMPGTLLHKLPPYVSPNPENKSLNPTQPFTLIFCWDTCAVQIRDQYFSQLKTVGRSEPFESGPSEKEVNSNCKTKMKTCPWLIRS